MLNFLCENARYVALSSLILGVSILVFISIYCLLSLSWYLVYGNIKTRYRVRFRFSNMKPSFHYGTYKYYFMAWFVKTVLQVNETNKNIRYWISKDVYNREDY